MQFKPIHQSFKVSYDYKLYFTQGVFEDNNPLFGDLIENFSKGESKKILFVLDSGVHEHHPYLAASVKKYCETRAEHLDHTDTLIVHGGEGAKNSEGNVTQILKAINEKSICRHSFVVVIGGGALTDMVGYAAAIAHRGVKLIRIPTTVLAQNDAAVGVKNGINLFGKKNFVGTFAPPLAIINDSDFLKTLEQRDWIAGVSEAVKVSLLKDQKFFEYIAKNALRLKKRNLEVMEYVVYHCAELHMEHIAKGGDPFEGGSSRPLDFGHWAAHKLEQMTAYAIRHGEAVAKGLALDLTYSCLKGFISNKVLNQTLNVLQDLGFDLYIPVRNKAEVSQLLEGIEEFREHLGGKLTITLIEGIGKQIDVHEIDLETMKKAIQALNQRTKMNVA